MAQKILNPVASRTFTHLYEPFVRSVACFFLFLLSIVLSLAAEFFNLPKVASKSILAKLLGIGQDSGACVPIYLFQCLLIAALLLFYINNNLSCGARLPPDVLSGTDLSGKVALVTGGYSGIGLETVLQLLKWNCKVIIAGRSKTKATNAIQFLKSQTKVSDDHLDFVEMDLNNLTSIKNAVNLIISKYKSLDLLINNAGFASIKFSVTSLKLEEHFSANFLGHFYLTSLLLPLVEKVSGRIINVSSIAHHRYDPNTDDIFKTKSTTALRVQKFASYYGRSKLYNIWFTHALQRRLENSKSKVVTFSLTPGVVSTPLLYSIVNGNYYCIPRFLLPIFFKDTKYGAVTTLYLCVTPLPLLVPGAYYSESKLGFVSKHAHDFKREEELYTFAEDLVKKLT
ncbi:short-chain dehydrogenase/reductase, putative [Theileria equi strain WA]|uniref:Short-chain dehydrogenase/reductase, putative n=1 Tax=Theileria equi strain WA TaxID=1537102 RepID=L0B032_THEEQ|nr:short-chain dehydrogenase/reductase, putative [Theileria equi strain WA]AFZ80616.1 short-chain dehydrogenase/reductase, putative [Theileria equi strain WA]|eukprot:XP_004830282.1 short-chain dehydrogenase/reductase, putative [Theileria equi strain WA]